MKNILLTITFLFSIFFLENSVSIAGDGKVILLPAGAAALGAGGAATTTTAAATTTTSTKLAASFADNPAVQSIRNAKTYPYWTLALSSIGTIYSKMLYDGAAQQEKDAKDNVAKIDKIIKSFKDSYTNFCPNGRESLNEPKCYCYLESGQQNPNRTNSQTCKDLWAKDSYLLSATAGNYSGVAQFVDPVGCVALNGQFDENCKCKKFVDAKGSNACMKTTNISIPSGLGSAFATGSGLQQVTTFSNNSTNGNPNLAMMSASQLNAKAINAQKMAQQIFTKLAPSLPPNVANLLKVDESNVRRLASAVIGEKGIQAAMKGSQSAVGFASSRQTDPKTAALLNQAAKKAGLVEVSGSGRGLSNKKADGKEAMNFNFLGDTGNTAASQTQNFPETQKNYNYKNSDISKSPDTSIFEIISNRYIQSGLKRLFDN